MTSTDVLLDAAVDAAVAANAAAAAASGALLAFVQARRADAVAAGGSPAHVEHVVEVAMDELASVLGLSSFAVQGRVRVAMTLRHDLPAVAAAHADGRLDVTKVRAIAQAAWRLERPESKAVLDQQVVPYAIDHSPVQVRQWLRRRVLRLEPDLVAARKTKALSERGVWFTHGDDGMAELHAVLASADALILERELTIAAKAARRTEAGDTDGRTLDQARADVLTARLQGEPSVPGGRGAFHIGVTVPLKTLTGLSTEPGTSVDGRFALDAETVRDLTRQPGTLFSRILTDPAGGVLDVIELGRFPSAALERALVLVDGVCAFPTCNASAVSADTDHVQPHPDGPTAGWNLIHLCRRHHRHKTRGLLRTSIDPDGRHRWHLPDETTTDSRTHLPRRHRPPPAPPPDPEDETDTDTDAA